MSKTKMFTIPEEHKDRILAQNFEDESCNLSYYIKRKFSESYDYFIYYPSMLFNNTSYSFGGYIFLRDAIKVQSWANAIIATKPNEQIHAILSSYRAKCKVSKLKPKEQIEFYRNQNKLIFHIDKINQNKPKEPVITECANTLTCTYDGINYILSHNNNEYQNMHDKLKFDNIVRSSLTPEVKHKLLRNFCQCPTDLDDIVIGVVGFFDRAFTTLTVEAYDAATKTLVPITGNDISLKFPQYDTVRTITVNASKNKSSLRSGIFANMNKKGFPKVNINDYIGKKFNHLLVVGIDPSNLDHVVCLCDCGRLSLVRPHNLHKNHTTSCGHCNDIDYKVGTFVPIEETLDYDTDFLEE